MYSYTRIWPRQIQSYKVHANYRPRPWVTIDGAIDIHENRDNVSQVNNLEHGRTYSFSTVLAPNSKFAFTLGYNYTDHLFADLHLLQRDTFRQDRSRGPGLPILSGMYPSVIARVWSLMGATEFYVQQPALRLQRRDVETDEPSHNDLGYTGTFTGGTERGSTLFLNPLQPAGTLAFNYQKPFASVQIDIYKGLSYKTTWNYYGYNSKAPINTSVPITNANAPDGTYDARADRGTGFQR